MLCLDIISQPGKKFAMLIDPDKHNIQSLITTVYAANEAGVHIILVGGSLVSDRIDKTIETIKKYTEIPVVLFPGSLLQLSNKADAALLLSLISGRNPDYLIGNHVLAAPYLKQSGIEIISTGYILIEAGNTTSVEYISNTKAIPADKADLVCATAMAGELLGMKCLYLESGSGAEKPISKELIFKVKQKVGIPIIVGGGMRTVNDVETALMAGADIVVVGNALERDINKIHKMVQVVNNF